MIVKSMSLYLSIPGCYALTLIKKNTKVYKQYYRIVIGANNDRSKSKLQICALPIRSVARLMART
jgi:hypothetical protein